MRQLSRNLAVLVIHSFMNSTEGLPSCVKHIIDSEADNYEKCNKKFFSFLIQATHNNMQDIQDKLASITFDHQQHRNNSVLTSILYVALCELLYSKTPKSVIIHEYISIADSIGSKHDTQVVNAILDSLELQS